MNYRLEDILSSVLSVLNISHKEWENIRRFRTAESIKVKQYTSVIARKFGYNDEGISRILHCHRSTIYHHIKTMRDLMEVHADRRHMVDSILADLSLKTPLSDSHVSHAWLARTPKGTLTMSPTKPELVGIWWVAEGSKLYNPQDAFPQITFEAGPIKVKIEVTIESNEQV